MLRLYIKLIALTYALVGGSLLLADNAALLPPPHQRFTDTNGKPLAGGKVYVCLAGTGCPGNPTDTWTDISATVKNANPIILDSTGYASIWIKAALYKIVVQDFNGVQQWTQDNVSNNGFVSLTTLTNLKCTANGLACLDINGYVPQNELAYTHGEPTATTRTLQTKLQEFVSAEDFAGADCGAKVNAAYLALPSTGGKIQVNAPCSFATPIAFSTPHKPVILQGKGLATALTYTGSSGTAITFNNGLNFDFGTRLQDIVLSGPGNSTGTIGVMIGGSNGCVGCGIDRGVIQSFGTNLKTGDNEWLLDVHNTMIRDGGTNVLMPSGTVQAGENIRFDHVVFADAPTPHTNSVWIQGGGQEVVFRDCSFDQAQLRIGNGATSAAQVTVSGSHFENPNFSVAGSVPYTYITVDNHNGNFIRVTDSYFLQDMPSGTPPAQFVELFGGKAVLTGIGMYTPVPMVNFAKLYNAVNVDVFSFNELSGSLTGTLLGGTTTGFIASMPGANTAGVSARNVVYKSGDAIGGAAMDFKGNIRTDSQLVSITATGTAPLVVNSTTPVQNLFGYVLTYDNVGNQVAGNQKVVTGTGALSAGTGSITFSGASVFTNLASYSCSVTDTSNPNGIQGTPASGTSVTVKGSGSDQFSYMCIGK